VVVKLRGDLVVARVMLVLNLNLLNSVLTVSSAVLAELAGQHSQADLGFHEVSARDLDEDILCVQSDFSSLAVDNWRQGKHLACAVVEDWIAFEGLQDRSELLHLHVGLEDFKKLAGIHAFLLLQRLEHDILRFASLVSNGCVRCKLVQIVRAHRSECSLAADIVVQFVLQVNERVVVFEVKRHVAQNTSNHVWANFLSLLLNYDLMEFLDMVFYRITGGLADAKIGPKSLADTLQAKQVVAVGGDFNLVDDFFADVNCIAIVVVPCHLHFLGRPDLQLDTVLEAKVFKLLISEFSAYCLEQFALQNIHVWHPALLSRFVKL